MIKELLKNIKKNKLIKAGDTVIIGTSGGRDSMALLFALHSLRDELGVKVVSAHFNHSLRGEASDGDEKFVSDFCKGLGIDFVSTAMPIAELAKGKNLEEVARIYRYGWLNEIADRYGDSKTAKIAVAHHAQDQAETVLLHLLRGSGTQGLKAMSFKSGRIIRPLLNIDRAVLEDYLIEHNIAYRDDATNFSNQYTRNSIRLDLMPELMKYNPAIVKALVTTADICGAEDDYLNECIEKIKEELIIDSEDGYAINRKELLKKPLALQRRLVRYLWQKVSKEEGGGLGYQHTDAVLALVKGKKLPLPQQVYAKSDGKNLYILRRDSDYLSTPKR